MRFNLIQAFFYLVLSCLLILNNGMLNAQKDANPCASSPCTNDYLCVPTSKTYKCVCVSEKCAKN